MKRLKKTVHSKNTTRKKNNGGMTYIELLVALSLLVLVVTVFSPMLLSSYDSLYKAGERTSEAYNARFDIENGLATRENDQILTVGTNFKTNAATLGNTIKITARRISSSFSGLETLYSGGKGVIKIVSDTLVKDNQSSHTVRIKLTNLAFDNYVIIKSASEFEQIKNDPTKLEGKVAFYITSVFDAATPLNGTVVNRPNFSSGDAYFPYVDILIEDIDITYSPIQFSAYYINDFGSMKVANTYLTITEADMIFVGKTTSDSDYFTLSDATIDNHPAVAGRVMYTAPIADGKVLTDVTFNQATNSLTEGFYAMCGENGITRRLWHLDATRLAQVKELDDTAVNEADTSKVSEPEIIYKSMSLGGATPYFQYDWAGDMTDLMAFTSSTNSESVIDYGDNSKSDKDFGNGDYIWKNEYNVDENYFAYNFDGFNANHGSYKDNHRRISYVLETTKEKLKSKYGVEPGNGVILRKNTYDKRDYNADKDYHGGQDETFVFTYTNGENRWYTFGTSKIKEKHYGLNNFVDGENAQISYGLFVSRDSAAKGNGWANNENASYDPDGPNDDDHKMAYVYLKSYNTISPGTLASGSLVQANTTASKNASKVNFTSCSVLPGTIESFYLGTLEANGIINETKGIVAAPGNSGYSTDEGLVQSWVLIQDGSTVYLNTYDQKALIDIGAVLSNGGNLRGLVAPNTAYGRNQYQTAYNSNNNIYKTWALQDTNAKFTMGYCSDLYAMYSSLAVRDMKPLESVYMGSYGAADNGDSDGDFRHNMWFPREFLNITESATYGTAMIAVGYDIGGQSKLYYDYSPEVSTSSPTYLLQGAWDMDHDNDGRVDALFGSYGNAPDLSLNTMLNTKLNGSSFLYPSFSQSGKQFYFIDINPGGGKREAMVALPRHIVTSTVVDALFNNGVISVYNSGDDSFTHIGYIKGSAGKSIRLNCVSMDMLKPAVDADGVGDTSSGVLGAAIGGSDGKVYLALIGYASGNIGKTPLVWNQSLFTIADYAEKFTSIESVKAFRNGDDFCILVGGRSKSKGADTVMSLITIKGGNVANVEHNVQILVPGSAYDITDFIIADGKIYLTAQDYDATHGAVGICPLTTNGVIDVSAANWTFIGDYYTEFSTDKASGGISVSGSKKTLPPLKALASTLPAE